MNTTYLIRCSAGALSIFALAACESHNARRNAGYASERNRDVTAYPRNSTTTMDRGGSRGIRQDRSDASRTGSGYAQHSGTPSARDGQSGNMTRNDAAAYRNDNDQYRGTMDRVDTRSPAWRNSSGATAAGTTVPSQQSGITTGGAANGSMQGDQWRSDGGTQGQTNPGPGAVNAPSHSAPTNVNDGTTYSDSQMGDQSQRSSNDTGWNRQSDTATSGAATRNDVNTGSAYSNTQQGGAATTHQGSSAASTSSGSANQQTWTAQSSSQQQDQTLRNVPHAGQQNSNAGGAYSDAQNNMAGTHSQPWQNERGSAQTDPYARNDRDDVTRRDDLYRQSEMSQRRDTNRDNTMDRGHNYSDRNRDVDTRYNNYDYGTGADNRHDGGAYSPALIYPNHGRSSGGRAYHSAPRDSGAGTSYPMSWQIAAFRARENNQRWDRTDRYTRDGYQDRSTDRRDADNRRYSDTPRNERDWDRRREDSDRNRSTNADSGRDD